MCGVRQVPVEGLKPQAAEGQEGDDKDAVIRDLKRQLAASKRKKHIRLSAPLQQVGQQEEDDMGSPGHWAVSAARPRRSSLPGDVSIGCAFAGPLCVLACDAPPPPMDCCRLEINSFCKVGRLGWVGGRGMHKLDGIRSACHPSRRNPMCPPPPHFCLLGRCALPTPASTLAPATSSSSDVENEGEGGEVGRLRKKTASLEAALRREHSRVVELEGALRQHTTLQRYSREEAMVRGHLPKPE